ncbi:SH3 domain-containing protein [Ahrensia sp. R2A130]|uniref:SH3 domain-containing protein n=1 Tax=Ahrensia sp. R2A130 TaxID=744979 RepID=UPI0001E0BC3A|nr:SH3 domain-containing protein [Ahrensia sp. R2A130]EFL90748.1 putative enterotoxin FM [Ahrensia sp. R2A130]
MTFNLRNTMIVATAFAAAMYSTTNANAEGYHVQKQARTHAIAYNDVLNVRAWPAASSRIKFGVNNNRKVYVQRCIIKSGTDWCKIRRGGRTGWVNGRYIIKGGETFARPHYTAYGWH